MLHVQLFNRILAPCHNMWITGRITRQGGIMGETQEVNVAVAPVPRFLDNSKEGHQLLQQTPTQMHIKLDRKQTTETVWSYIHHFKEPTAAGIQDTITHRLGQFLKVRISRD
jgi:hypothetical protein